MLRRIVPPRAHASRYRDAEERHTPIPARLLALVTIVSGLIYIVWICFIANREHPFVSSAFVIAEAFCLLLFTVASFTVWELRYKPPEGLPITAPQSVDVFVTVCGEPFEVVHATLDAIARIDWHGSLKVYVLDDGENDRLETLAQRLGFICLTRRGTDAPQGHATRRMDGSGT